MTMRTRTLLLGAVIAAGGYAAYRALTSEGATGPVAAFLRDVRRAASEREDELRAALGLDTGPDTAPEHSAGAGAVPRDDADDADDAEARPVDESGVGLDAEAARALLLDPTRPRARRGATNSARS